MEFYLSVIAFCFASSISPGPNNIMLMTSSLNFGIKKSIPHFFGIITGFPFMIALLGLGLGVVFTKLPIIHSIIKYVGITYLLYLAWRVATIKSTSKSTKPSKPLSYIQVVMFQWVNPKAWTVAMGTIATYTSVDNYVFQMVFIVATYFLVGGMCMIIWMYFGSLIKNIIKQPKALKKFNLIMGLLLALSVLPMIYPL